MEPKARCAQIAAEHSLTPRETEVFTLLARGRVVGFVCAELYISRNTANAHRRAIYSKLGIYSQQELLDIVEDGLGGNDAIAGKGQASGEGVQGAMLRKKRLPHSCPSRSSYIFSGFAFS